MGDYNNIFPIGFIKVNVNTSGLGFKADVVKKEEELSVSVDIEEK